MLKRMFYAIVYIIYAIFQSIFHLFYIHFKTTGCLVDIDIFKECRCINLGQTASRMTVGSELSMKC